MTPSYKQLELDLWGDLKTALTRPESADMQLLWHSLEEAIAYSDSNEQLLVAGDAITQIVEVYVKRAKSILDSLVGCIRRPTSHPKHHTHSKRPRTRT